MLHRSNQSDCLNGLPKSRLICLEITFGSRAISGGIKRAAGVVSSSSHTPGLHSPPTFKTQKGRSGQFNLNSSQLASIASAVGPPFSTTDITGTMPSLAMASCDDTSMATKTICTTCPVVIVLSVVSMSTNPSKGCSLKTAFQKSDTTRKKIGHPITQMLLLLCREIHGVPVYQAYAPCVITR
jgi:hypothetical protein